jgi:tetratricopeptide (TPR) repeat protein
VADKHGERLVDVHDWMPLLQFTRGNPMTLTVVVRQALRDGRRTREQIETFVDRLRSGEAAFDEEASEGRDRSLGASLAYGFEHAFTEAERAQLALLHLFQGFVDVDALCWMGNPASPWCLPEVGGLTREEWIALLDRAAEIGLLSSHGGGYYYIHPALPWFFRNLFRTHYASIIDDERSAGLRASRAFVEAIAELGNYYSDQFSRGNRHVIDALSAEEANLLFARLLARTHDWHRAIIGTMQGLRALYMQTGRRAEWARLVDEIVPNFVDASGSPIVDREDDWSLVTEYRIGLASESRNWPDAERMSRVLIEWNRERASAELSIRVETLNETQRNRLRSLAASLHQLGEIQRERGQPECVALYEQALSLDERIADDAAAAVCAFNLGNAYRSLQPLRDLDRAEHWYSRSLELRDERDSQGRARCIGQLGYIAYDRFGEALNAKAPEAELLRHLNAALELYLGALDLLPASAVDDLRVTHLQLGNIYASAGDRDTAHSHWHEAIHLAERGADHYGAGRIRFNLARSLALEGRYSDARDYALAALRSFKPYGDGAGEDIERTQRLLSRIEQDLQSQSGG